MKNTTQNSTADFSAQYKDPRWQRKRLEILTRDNFTCLSCGATDKQLHVHHCNYYKNEAIYDAWNYGLVTLCEDCHDLVHQLKFRINCSSGWVLAESLLRGGEFKYSDVLNLVSYLSGPIEDVPKELKDAVYALRADQAEILAFMNGEK